MAVFTGRRSNVRGGLPCGGDHRQPVLSTGAKPALATYWAHERKQIDDFSAFDDDFHQKLAQIADCQLRGYH